MIDAGINRRQFLKVLISLPLAYTIGCQPEQKDSAAVKFLLSPEESLRKLLFILGPWPAGDREEAKDFARRFLTSKYTVSSYLPESGELVQSLAARFPDGVMAVHEINLRGLPAKEKDLLMKLVRQLYSFIEIRFYAAHEPPWGECGGGRMRHTRAPV